jgi:hypothetical protein
MVNIKELQTGDVIVRKSSGRRYIVKVFEDASFRIVSARRHVSARIEKDGRPHGREYGVSELNATDFTNEWLIS